MVQGYPRSFAIILELLVDRGRRLSAAGLPMLESTAEKEAREEYEGRMSAEDRAAYKNARKSTTDQWIIGGSDLSL